MNKNIQGRRGGRLGGTWDRSNQEFDASVALGRGSCSPTNEHPEN